MLIATGSAKAQGFYFSEPVDPEQALLLLRHKTIDADGAEPRGGASEAQASGPEQLRNIEVQSPEKVTP